MGCVLYDKIREQTYLFYHVDHYPRTALIASLSRVVSVTPGRCVCARTPNRWEYTAMWSRARTRFRTATAIVVVLSISLVGVVHALDGAFTIAPTTTPFRDFEEESSTITAASTEPESWSDGISRVQMVYSSCPAVVLARL